MKITSLLPPAAAVLLLTAAVLAATTAAQTQHVPGVPPMPAAPASMPRESQAPAPPLPQRAASRGLAQDAQPAPASTQAPGGGRPRNFPAPTNLKVLPKDLTGAQVRDIMEKWAGSLGVHCDTCHTADPNNVGPNGRPRLNFADDSKPDKQIARIMYTMTQQMNTDYISKAMDLDKDGDGTPVTCGTCHRGHKMPEEFVIPREQRPGGPGAGPGGAPAGGTMPMGGAPPTN